MKKIIFACLLGSLSFSAFSGENSIDFATGNQQLRAAIKSAHIACQDHNASCSAEIQNTIEVAYQVTEMTMTNICESKNHDIAELQASCDYTEHNLNLLKSQPDYYVD
nr:hypothetical protein [uncultured Moellerella sp.]